LDLPLLVPTLDKLPESQLDLDNCTLYTATSLLAS